MDSRRTEGDQRNDGRLEGIESGQQRGWKERLGPRERILTPSLLGVISHNFLLQSLTRDIIIIQYGELGV